MQYIELKKEVIDGTQKWVVKNHFATQASELPENTSTTRHKKVTDFSGIVGRTPEDQLDSAGTLIDESSAKALLNPGTNEAVIFDDGRWSKVPDFTGTTYYSKETAQPIELNVGDAEPSSRTSTTVVPPMIGGRPDPGAVFARGGWSVPTEVLARRARARRNKLLLESDIVTSASDYPISAEGLELIIAYRESLRTLPEQSGFPENITWPEWPENVPRPGV